ncbi:MAG: CopD family protein, partial [Rhodocyclaceae bacterium]|nr:CopD family protein [Rhodocyclaceae bacterium]
AVFARFFPCVWVAVALLLASGFARLGSVGFAAAPRHWHVMMGIGIVMVLIFMHVYFAPYARLRRAVAAQDWPAGGAALGQIRQLVGVNLTLGACNIGVAALGRWLAA